MNLTQKENKLLIIVSIVGAICFAIPWMGEKRSNEYLLAQQRDVRELRESLAEYEQNIAGIDEQRQLLQANRQDYINWVNKGVVGRQNPVEWINLMKEIQRGRNLFVGQYNFSDERVVSPGTFPVTQDGSVNLVFQEMGLVMPMLHDMDLFMFLGDLQDRTDSFFLPIECEFSRNSDDFDLVNQENMNSDCVIHWISVQDSARLFGLESEQQGEQG